MLQHMVLTYFMPACMLLATPTWLARTVIGNGGVYRAVRWLAKPVVAGLVFNVMVVVTHIPALVNGSIEVAGLHYSLHLLLVVTSLLMWMPICGPLPELRISIGGQMIYLFLLSIIPTVPAGWLTFADGVVYHGYDVLPRVFGLSPTHDQQLAGAIMKVGGSVFLWSLIVLFFFKKFAANWEQQTSYRRVTRSSAPLAGLEEKPLVFEEVARAFETTPAVPEPQRAAGPAVD
jgi:putative membrane protein